ncbi:MAG: response regulator [Nitrospinota bacterium]
MESGKVFLIEDEHTQKVSLAEALKKAGMQVAAGSGEDMLAKIKQMKPDLVITDLVASEVADEAIEFVEKIKSDDSLKKTKIFIYTKNLNVSLEVALRRLKISDYFIKDDNIDFIVKSVKEHFQPEKDVDTSLIDRSRAYDLAPPPPYMKDVVPAAAAPVPQPPPQAPGAPVQEEKETFNEMFTEFSDKVHEQLGDKDVETFYNLGISYMEMELYQEAINEFRSASRGDQFKQESTHMIGVCLRKLGKFAESIAQFKKAAKIIKDPVELMGVKYEIGLTLTEAGKLKEAFNALGSIYKQDKKYRDVAKRLVEIKKKLQGK